MNRTAPRDWDAVTYDRVSDPQVEMAGPVLDRLPLAGDETVLDAGCGSGRVTELLLERLPRGRVIAVDGAPTMVDRARRRLARRPVTVLHQNLVELRLDAPADAAFSNAVFHWIGDHEALFARLHAALRPGGRLVAQCGGHGNIDHVRAVGRGIATGEPYAEHLQPFPEPWHYATPEDTAARLEQAGFDAIETWLEPWEVRPSEPFDYLRSVCLGPYVERLPEDLRDDFVHAVIAELGDPVTLDYVRLNIQARA
jgi:trans-aconitate 2-methyltransferase